MSDVLLARPRSLPARIPSGAGAAFAVRGAAAGGRALRRVASPLLLVALWQIASSAGLISPRTLASPASIAASFWQLVQDGTLPADTLVSLARVAAGLAIAVVAGVAMALVAGLSRLGEDAVDAPMQMARTLPHLALVPLFILWFGIGETPKIALVALGAVFPIYLNLFAAIRGVDPKLVESARVLGLSRTEMVREVILPGALPGFLVGLRYAVGIGWLSLVVGEQINSSSGLGYMMMDARDFLRTDIIMVGLLSYAILGLGADLGVRWLERRLLSWRPVLLAR